MTGGAGAGEPCCGRLGRGLAMRGGMVLMAVLALAGCLGRHPAGDGIARLLAGRTVAFDLPESLHGTGAKAETQTWRADGTTTYGFRPWLVPQSLSPREGRWWVEGNRYCQTFAPRPDRGVPTCYHLRVTEEGRRIEFDAIRDSLIVIFDLSRAGRFVD
ncbi:hypothetical protein [Ruixingdingia sedimenti]|uniref:Lipoprotein n=1 Tax=Ruixingdingia sedimenti TaxID=3073604 RepID=A0ABU1FDM2_9RHOB|nr:hypothetical protein [Xinfangfangia sp. LG-4]MDR5655009.1 hypothetical protein [Xinfangfangia sp. LG-4]